jgi:hypothetical protein
MSDTETIDMVNVDDLPGHESQLEPKPTGSPRIPAPGGWRARSP